MGKRKQQAIDRTPLRLLPKAPVKKSVNSCHVTGEARDYRLPVVRVDEADRVYHPQHAEPERLNGWLVALPLILHSRKPDGTGAPQSSGPLVRYWDAGLPERRNRPQRLTYQEKYWWTPVWAERELFAHFDADAVDIVLAIVRDGQSWDAAMVGSTRAHADVGALLRKMAQHCQAIIRTEAIAA